MMLKNSTKTSYQLFERAQISIPGGVNSPVRAFKSVGGTPVFFKEAQGAYLYDEDGNRYIDLIASWGPMILGHSHPEVVEAVVRQVHKAFSFGAPTRLEIEMAELMKEMVPGLELVRMVNSGTEACMSAIRLARGYTGKNKFIKFEGCYHGHADPFLVKAGSGVATFDIQTVPGVTGGTAHDTLTAPYNDIDAVQNLVDQNPGDIAAIIVEPVAGNMGCVPPIPGFLEKLRIICDRYGIILIFDEVMTGFRLAPGGAQERLGVRADLVTFGKVIGGGLPVGAFGGNRDIMSAIAPLGKVYQAGTLSGNPLAMTAGYSTLSILHNNPQIYSELDHKTQLLEQKLSEALSVNGWRFISNRLGSMLSFHFDVEQVTNFEEAAAANQETFRRFFHHMLGQGVYLPPSAFESYFLSNALTLDDIDYIAEAASTFSA
ncbi:MAG: glutamate-1-semialdehyde 2,1-aminomutase [Thermaurantimonas sp.]|uniref:glutamate-1-semialdehyde 2,1-aminomutase n=1 Tax=Thermaurantimonas sp. TaxID=2681568 RepID=UPI00391C158E